MQTEMLQQLMIQQGPEKFVPENNASKPFNLDRMAMFLLDKVDGALGTAMLVNASDAAPPNIDWETFGFGGLVGLVSYLSTFVVRPEWARGLLKAGTIFAPLALSKCTELNQDLMIGISVGALVGALLQSFGQPDYIEEEWEASLRDEVEEDDN